MCRWVLGARLLKLVHPRAAPGTASRAVHAERRQPSFAAPFTHAFEPFLNIRQVREVLRQTSRFHFGTGEPLTCSVPWRRVTRSSFPSKAGELEWHLRRTRYLRRYALRQESPLRPIVASRAPRTAWRMAGINLGRTSGT